MERKERGREPLHVVEKNGEVHYVWRIGGVSRKSLKNTEVKKLKDGTTVVRLVRADIG